MSLGAGPATRRQGDVGQVVFLPANAGSVPKIKQRFKVSLFSRAISGEESLLGTKGMIRAGTCRVRTSRTR